MPLALDCLRQALEHDGAFLRPLAGALVYAAIVAAFGRPLRPAYGVPLALAISAWVLAAAWPAFLAINAAAYLIVGAMATSRRRELWSSLCLAALAALFISARVLEWDHRSVDVFGTRLSIYYLDMWMLLRLFTFTWEVGRGLVAMPDAGRYVTWVANPLLLGGPLVRLSQWPATVTGKHEALAAARWRPGLAGAGMIVVGLCLEAAELAARGVAGETVGVKLAHVLFVGPWTFYLVVAGFYRLVEWLGGWCGVHVPTSFRFPFFMQNIAEFWARWNLTATMVFRDYFFYNRWGLRSYNIYVNTMIVFLSVGLWHGANLYWITFGLLHGLFFCAYLWSRPRLSAFARRRWFEYGSIAVTYVAICAAWYLPSKIVIALTGK